MSLTIVFVLCGVFQTSLSTSLMHRIRERQGEDVSDTKGLDLETEDWLQVPPVIHDALLSIDEKLKGLDTFSHTLKLARLDLSLDQLSRRMENIETKLGRLETKFDARMEKVEEVVISKDIKEEFSNEYLSRRMETLNEKINSKASYLEAKLDFKLERVTNKLELLERDLHNSMDEILERLIKNDERYSTLERESSKRERTMSEMSNNLLEMKLFLKEDIPKIIASRTEEVSKKLDGVQTAIYVSSNQEEKAISEVNRTITAVKEYVQDSSRKLRNMGTCSCSQSTHLNNLTVSARQLSHSPLRDLKNLTATLETRLQAGEAKLQEIGSDVDLYTRKVVNGIQELWKTADQLKTDLSTSLNQSNETREFVKQEFRKLQKQIEPLPMLEPRLVKINSDIDNQISELGKTVDHSFATLLVAQNSFISSCRLIQEEEMHVYDILQQIVHEMRNRSTQDIKKIDTEIRRQGDGVKQSLSAIASAVMEVGNSTTRAVDKLRKQMSLEDKCESGTKTLHLETVYELCRQIVVEPASSDEKMTKVIGNTAALKEIRRKILQALADASSAGVSEDYAGRHQQEISVKATRKEIDNVKTAHENDPIHIASDYEMDYRISNLDYK